LGASGPALAGHAAQVDATVVAEIIQPVGTGPGVRSLGPKLDEGDDRRWPGPICSTPSAPDDTDAAAVGPHLAAGIAALRRDPAAAVADA